MYEEIEVEVTDSSDGEPEYDENGKLKPKCIFIYFNFSYLTIIQKFYQKKRRRRKFYQFKKQKMGR